MPLRPLFALLALGSAACLPPVDEGADDTDAADTTETADTTDTTETDAATGDPTVRIGAFQITLVAPTESTAGATTVVGRIYDGPTPEAIVWEDAVTEGECRLVTPRVPFCETPCGGDAVCVEDDTCQPWPTSQDVGTATLTGLSATDGSSSFDMTPLNKTWQKPPAVTLAWPPFAAGDPLTLTLAGSDFAGAFTVEGSGIDPLDLSGGPWTLDGVTPMALAWTPAAAGGSRVSVKLDISHHGGTRGQILCDADDDGALIVSAAMIQSLLDLGVSGFPSVVVTRASTGSTTLAAGRVDLVASSTVETFVSVPGLVSCTTDDECPEGQTCQDDLTCQ